MIQCAYWKEEIQDGAIVCRYCGRKQPSGKRRLRLRYVLPALGLMFIFVAWLAEHDYASGQERLANATRCGNLDVATLQAVVKEGQDKGLSLKQATDAAVYFACPSSIPR